MVNTKPANKCPTCGRSLNRHLKENPLKRGRHKTVTAEIDPADTKAKNALYMRRYRHKLALKRLEEKTKRLAERTAELESIEK